MQTQQSQNCHPDMGSHIMIDFHNIENFSLTDPKPMMELLEETLKKTDCTICDQKVTQYNDERGYSILFLLSESHLSVHTIPSLKAFSIDFYNCGYHSWNNLKIVEESICSIFGWKNASSTILIPRGRGKRMIGLEDVQETLIQTETEFVKQSPKKISYDREPAIIEQKFFAETGIS